MATNEIGVLDPEELIKLELKMKLTKNLNVSKKISMPLRNGWPNSLIFKGSDLVHT